jgi:hypothetical protein
MKEPMGGGHRGQKFHASELDLTWARNGKVIEVQPKVSD